ncbi:hypothetical protein EV657_10955 [Rhodovulum visakhapatnamense]|uniref:Uncharacterized protein n=1 Tax=Rhodovulum visakhapatnamense TaxID=364297 RepID=A0A4R8FY83_9RHOB|nr:hypothetical protein EV657_10955 [Rhodovulum visakhapatnamense]
MKTEAATTSQSTIHGKPTNGIGAKISATKGPVTAAKASFTLASAVAALWAKDIAGIVVAAARAGMNVDLVIADLLSRRR